MKRPCTFYSFLICIALLSGSNAIGQSMAKPMEISIPGASQLPVNNSSNPAYRLSQKSVPVQNVLANKPANYRTFTKPTKYVSAEAIAANAKYKNHPEVNQLFSGAPCKNCYELMDKRTETTKTFTEEGGTVIMTQTSNMPMHYRDIAGNWRTIKTELEPVAGTAGIYAAAEQPVPVTITTAGNKKFTSLGKAGNRIQFNSNLELVYQKPDGSEESLGAANWTNHTAGDEGVYVKDAWAGVDIEVRVYRGAVKTNFILNKAMPAYANGKMLVRDHMEMDNGLSLVSPSGNNHSNDVLEIKNTAGESKYVISPAIVAESGNATLPQQLQYTIRQQNIVDIELPGAYLNKPASSYPVIIDPLVTQNTSVAVNGASYNATWATLQGCLYSNPANTPPNCTITDIQFTFQYISNVGMQYCAFSLYKGTCRSPTPTAQSWSCNSPLAGTCTANGGTNYSIYNSLSSCLPAPSCASIPLNIDMYFYQNWQNTPPCVTTYVYGSQPFVVTVIGRTVEITAGGTVSATPSTICNGQSSTLNGAATAGVPPYTWSWSPGPIAGSPAVVSPSSTTTYTATVTDACGITASANTTVTVNPIAPITGPTSVCMGTTITLNNTAAGTWSSLSPAVATIDQNTGVLTGVSPGQAAIRFTTTAGCQANATITVTPLPGPITGNTTLCVGFSSTLANSAPGGTWISSAPTIADVNVSSGSMLGVSAGNATITYTFGGTCYVTTSVTINPLQPIIGISTLCESDSTQLSNEVSGGLWSSSNAAVASIDGATTTLYGISGGTATITYLNPFGCTSTLPVTINALPVIGNIAFTDPTTCGGTDGSITLTSFSGSAYAIDYTFNSASVPTATITPSGSQLQLGGLVQGTYNNFVVTDANTGCISAPAGPVTLADPAPPPPPTFTDNMPLCAGQTLQLYAVDDLPGGTFDWIGPDGFTANTPDVEIVNAPVSASGPYTVTYTLKNCPVSTTRVITITPPLTLTNVTPDQTIKYGSSVQLNAQSALYYEWLPQDGSLSNANINNPIAAPKDSTTYTVVGTNAAGCKDTAYVIIRVDHNMNEFIPSAFSPNGDGLNDVFRVGNMTYQKLVEFTIYNRWGQLVYQNNYDLKQGWDGTYNGTPQDAGVYTYKISVINAEGVTKYYKGDVMLVR